MLQTILRLTFSSLPYSINKGCVSDEPAFDLLISQCSAVSKMVASCQWFCNFFPTEQREHLQTDQHMCKVTQQGLRFRRDTIFKTLQQYLILLMNSRAVAEWQSSRVSDFQIMLWAKSSQWNLGIKSIRPSCYVSNKKSFAYFWRKNAVFHELLLRLLENSWRIKISRGFFKRQEIMRILISVYFGLRWLVCVLHPRPKFPKTRIHRFSTITKISWFARIFEQSMQKRIEHCDFSPKPHQGFFIGNINWRSETLSDDRNRGSFKVRCQN